MLYFRHDGEVAKIYMLNNDEQREIAIISASHDG